MTKRIQISLTPSVAEVLERMATDGNVSQAEIVRRAVLREHWFEQRLKEGCTLLLENPDGEIKEIVFISTI